MSGPARMESRPSHLLISSTDELGLEDACAREAHIRLVSSF